MLPLATPVRPQLAALAARLGAASGAGAAPAPGGAPGSPEELAAGLDALVTFLERCADGVALQKLDALAGRLERRFGLQPPIGGASPPPSVGVAAMVDTLGTLVTRMEAAAGRSPAG